MNTREIGKFGENLAEKYLLSNGYHTICKNYYSNHGEIDIISKIDKYIVFVEVKTRNSNSYFRPVLSVGIKKQRRLIYTATDYIINNNVDLQPRFDVIEVILGKKKYSINHIINAFYQEDINEIF